MKAILFQELRTIFKAPLIWGIVLVVFTILSMTKYDALALDIDGTLELMEAMPDILISLYGLDSVDVTTLSGYFAVVHLYMLIALCIFGAMQGGKAVMEEENDKTADFLFTKPLSRKKIILMKYTAIILKILVPFTIYFTGTYFILSTYNENLDFFMEFAVGAFVMIVFYSSLALLLSCLKYNKKAVLIAAAIIIYSYVLEVLISVLDWKIHFITPFGFFTGNNLLNARFNLFAALVYLALAIVFVISSMFLIERRDIRV